MQTTPIDVAPANLLLDPNNYRFHDLQDYKMVGARARWGEPAIQLRALQFLQNSSFEVGQLMESIRKNGFVPLERIVVERIESGIDPAYIVVEGNRRVAAVKLLLREFDEGTGELSEETRKSLLQLPAIEIGGAEDERREYRQTLMAIRHISGIKQWGAYQQAELIVELMDKDHQTPSAIAARIGISSADVGRRYRAFKALAQMQEDEEYGKHAEPKLYAAFQEAVSQPKVREWLAFSPQTYRAENEENKRSFYQLLSPTLVDDERRPPKMHNANVQVRKLKDIVDKPRALDVLLDSDTTFDDAVRVAYEETQAAGSGSQELESNLKAAFNALRRPGIQSWLNPSQRARESWKELVELIEQVKGLMAPK